MDRKIRDHNRFVSIDIEGNGASPPEPVQIAGIVFNLDATITEEHVWLVKPTKSITNRASRVHNLSDLNVATAPPISVITPDLLSVLNRGPLVAHNAGICISILKRVVIGYEPETVIDTLALSRKHLRGLESYKLYPLLESLDLGVRLEATERHRSLIDCRASMTLLLHILHACRLELP